MTSDGTVEVTYPESSSGARLLMGTLTFKPRNKPDIGDIGYFLVVEEGKVMHLSQSQGDLGWASRKPNPSPSSWLLPWTAGLVNCYNLALLGTKSKRNEGEFLTHSLPVALHIQPSGVRVKPRKRQLQPGVMDKERGCGRSGT